MNPDQTTVDTFNVRELQFQDQNGRQVVLRVDSAGNIACSGVFDKNGARVQEYAGEIQLNISVKGPETMSATMRLCCWRDAAGNMWCRSC